MPLYEYRCNVCGEEFEALQKISDAPLSGCRSCSGTVSKLVSRSGFQFKGSGWYVTDYAGKQGSKPKSEGKEAKEGKEGEASDKPKKEPTEAKPADGGDSSSAKAATPTPTAPTASSTN